MNMSEEKIQPIEISSIEDLQSMNNDLNADYILVNDIDASETDQWNDGKGFNPIGPNADNPFKGTFDGQGHAIRNLYIDRSTEEYVGLFGRTTGKNVRISNVKLKEVRIKGGSYVGGLIGYSGQGTTTYKSKAQGNIRSNRETVGGLIGISHEGEVQESSFKGTVTGSSEIGGLIGYTWKSKVSKSYSNASVKGLDWVGGLIGENEEGEIKNTYTIGKVVGKGNEIGGLIGYNKRGTIHHSFSTSSVISVSDKATKTGGLIGNNSGGEVIKSYWNTETSEQKKSDGGEKSNTEQMTDYANNYPGTYEGWDFKQVWFATDWNKDQEGNKGYPALDLETLLNPPTNPEPEDGAEKVKLTPTLKVDVNHNKAQRADVIFINASNNAVIGIEKDVEKGERASVKWGKLKKDSAYEWYAVAKDGGYIAKSKKWSFTTKA